MTAMISGVGRAGEKPGGGGHAGSIGKLTIERKVAPRLPTVVFYVLPRCGICRQIDRWLIQFDRENPRVANYVRKNSTDKTHHPEMQTRGIHHHGLVFLGLETNILWAAQAHGLRKEKLTQAFTQHVVSQHRAPDGKPSTP